MLITVIRIDRMTLKEKFLKIESYDDFDAVREEYGNLDWNDKEISDHFIVLLDKAKPELLDKLEPYKFPSISDGLMIDFVMDDK